MFQNDIDSHTHTLASGHAYNTVLEMAKTASEKGLKTLAVTEHAMAMPGTCHEFYFMNLKSLPRTMFGIEVLFGAELNIRDDKGGLDMEEELLRQMDVCVASLHLPCIRPGTVMKNTKALVRACENPLINILGHPDDGRYPVDYDEVVSAAKENHVLLELNNHSLEPGGPRKNAWENDTVMLEKCVKYGARIILDSDAHWCGDIARTDHCMALLRQVDFPMELVVNDRVDLYHSYINRYREKSDA